MFMAECNGCHTKGFTEDASARGIADAVRCNSPADSPEGSVDGCCASDGKSHDEHVQHVHETGDSVARPLTIYILPGSVELTGVIGGN